ncbi:MAG: retron system putative HNH endonuclease [Polyangia bacterium]
MQRITKQPEPPFLAGYRRNPAADWDQDVRGEEKKAAREQLCAEQGALCCFCEGRIRPEPAAMKIAHFVPQAVDKVQMFVWSNLLGACLGGQGQPPKQQHCDTRQGSATLDPRLHPVLRLVPGTISFDTQGQIVAAPAKLQAELDEKLNLNLEQLRRNRRAAADAMIRQIGSGQWTQAEIERKCEELRERSVAPRAEYQSYLLWWLERRLRAAG